MKKTFRLWKFETIEKRKDEKVKKLLISVDIPLLVLSSIICWILPPLWSLRISFKTENGQNTFKIGSLF